MRPDFHDLRVLFHDLKSKFRDLKPRFHDLRGGFHELSERKIHRWVENIDVQLKFFADLEPFFADLIPKFADLRHRFADLTAKFADLRCLFADLRKGSVAEQPKDLLLQRTKGRRERLWHSMSVLGVANRNSPPAHQRAGGEDTGPGSPPQGSIPH